MANSRKSKSDLEERVSDALCLLVPPRHTILLGLSGGMDSVVLLHLLHALAPKFDWRVSAIHVHHGLSPNADDWADFCRDLCARYDIPLQVEQVDVRLLRNEHGIEAAARKLRYAAFAQQTCDFIALAHHADDQAETLLLQLLRGAGVRGAASMPMLKPALKQAAATLRPLLEMPRSALFAYAQQHDLSWIEDESNNDDSYGRNFLRHRIFPELEHRFPAYRETLARSVRHFAEASELLDALAQQDALNWVLGDPLELALLRSLSHPRARNLLRYVLHLQGAPMPHDVQLDEMLCQLLGARANASVCENVGAWQVRRYQDKVYVLRKPAQIDPALSLSWDGEAELDWPASGKSLSFAKVQGQGISLQKLQHAPVTFRLRSGGEVLCPHLGAATRSLKNLLQEHRIPPWQRERLPLLYCGSELAAVVGLAVAAEFQASSTELGIIVT